MEEIPEIELPDKYRLTPEEEQRVLNLGYAIPLKLRQILRGFKWAMAKKNTSAVMMIDGKSGMGKSTLAFQIGDYMDKDFNLSKVYYNPTQFLEGLEQAKPGSCHVFDEAMLLSNRSAMSQVNRAVIMAMSMIRSKRLFIIFNINSIFDMERNLVLSRGDILLHIYGDSLTDRGKFMAFFKGSDGKDRLKLLHILGKKYYDYSKPKSNFNSNFSSYFVLDEAEYERKKQEGVKDFLLGNEKPINSKYRYSLKKALHNMLADREVNCKNCGFKVIAPGMNQTEAAKEIDMHRVTVNKMVTEDKYV